MWIETNLGNEIKILTDYTANGSFESLKKNVIYFNEPCYAVLVRTTDLGKLIFKPERFTDEKGYNFLKTVHLFGGEIVVANVGSLGKAYRIPQYPMPMVLAPNMYLIKFKESVDEDFIYQYFISSFFKNSLFKVIGSTTLQAVNKDSLRSLKLNLPLKPEQTQIAEILLKSDEAIASTEAIIAKYKRIKTGLMQDLLTQGIDERGNIRSRSTHKFVVKNGIQVPEEWEVERLVSLCANKKQGIQTGPFGAQLHAHDYVDEGIPVILIRNIVDGKIQELGIPRITLQKAKELKRYQIKCGDIIFSRVGDVGRVAIADIEHSGWILSGQMLRVRLENENVYTPYLKYLTQSFEFKQLLKKEILGTTRDSINTKILENLLIRLPKKDEQIRIGRVLEKIDKTIEKIEIYLSKTNSIKTGLMQDLLSGKVSLPEGMIKQI